MYVVIINVTDDLDLYFCNIEYRTLSIQQFKNCYTANKLSITIVPTHLVIHKYICIMYVRIVIVYVKMYVEIALQKMF